MRKSGREIVELMGELEKGVINGFAAIWKEYTPARPKFEHGNTKGKIE